MGVWWVDSLKTDDEGAGEKRALMIIALRVFFLFFLFKNEEEERKVLEAQEASCGEHGKKKRKKV